MTFETTSSSFVDIETFESVPQECGEVIQRYSRSFSLASRLLPAAIRKDVQMLYAWCRWCDEAVDSGAGPRESNERLEGLRDDVIRVFDAEDPKHPASRWLAELNAKFGLDRSGPIALLEGMEMDLMPRQIESEAELLHYCYCAAGVVGLMMCEVLDVSDHRARRHALSLGIAMQLTNIARDVREDHERKRCYLPKQWLPGGVSNSSDDQIRQCVRRLLDLAEFHYQVGANGMRYLPPNARPAIQVAAAVYREIGQQIRRGKYDVMSGRTVLPKLRFASTALIAWFRGSHHRLWSSVRSKLPTTLTQDTSSFPEIFAMNDAKYLAYLGISLTGFMSTALFVLVAVNPKEDSYATLPLIYAVLSLAVAILTNLLAKQHEASPAVTVQSSNRPDLQESQPDR